MSNLLVGALICGARPIADTQNKWWVYAVIANLDSLKDYAGWSNCFCPVIWTHTLFMSLARFYIIWRWVNK
jgi:hypothetical protein